MKQLSTRLLNQEFSVSISMASLITKIIYKITLSDVTGKIYVGNQDAT